MRTRTNRIALFGLGLFLAITELDAIVPGKMEDTGIAGLPIIEQRVRLSRAPVRRVARRRARVKAPASPNVSLSFEPMAPSFARRAMARIPMIGGIQRRSFSSGWHFIPARLAKRSPVVPLELRAANAGRNPIDLKLVIDKTGNVSETELLSRGLGAHASRLAVTAASRWDFIPARYNNRPVASEMLVHMRFGN